MIAPNRGPQNWLRNQIERWKQETDTVYEDDSGLTDTEKLQYLGVDLEPAHDGSQSFGLLYPGDHWPNLLMFRVDSAGNAAICAESMKEDGAERMLREAIDGSVQRGVAAFYAALDRREDSVREDVSAPLRAAGYTVTHTGGGILAWFRPLSPDGEHHILLTGEDEIDGDPDAREWVIGRYAAEGWLCIDETFTLADAIKYADLLPPPVSSDGVPMEEMYPTVAAARAALLGESVDDA
jgi:hypothetical protein